MYWEGMGKGAPWDAADSARVRAVCCKVCFHAALPLTTTRRAACMAPPAESSEGLHSRHTILIYGKNQCIAPQSEAALGIKGLGRLGYIVHVPTGPDDCNPGHLVNDRDQLPLTL